MSNLDVEPIGRMRVSEFLRALASGTGRTGVSAAATAGPPPPSILSVEASPPSLRTVSMSKAEWDKGQPRAGPGPRSFPITARAGPTRLSGAEPPVRQRGPYQSVSAAEELAVVVEGEAGAPPREASGPGDAEAAPPPPARWGGGGGGAAPPPDPRYEGRSLLGLPLISCYSRGYVAWALLILVLDLTWSSFLLPISIGFQARAFVLVIEPLCVSDLEGTWACVIDLIAGTLCFCELLLGFHVTFQATSGTRRREVTDGRRAPCWGRGPRRRAIRPLIAHYYVFDGSFAQDLLVTALWLTQIALLGLARSGVIRIIRMVRFASVLRAIYALSFSMAGRTVLLGVRFSSQAAQTASTLFGFCVLLNFFSCMWNFIMIKEGFSNTWANNVAQLVRQYAADGEGALTPEELAGVPAGRRYLTGLYFSLETICTLGYGDITPSTAIETVVSLFVMALGVLLFGLAMGSLAEMMYEDKLAAVDAWVRSSGLAKPLAAKIRLFYSDIWPAPAAAAAGPPLVPHSGAVGRPNATDLFAELPHKMRAEVALSVNALLLGQVPPFAGLEGGLLGALASCMCPVEELPGQELALPGDLADRLWLLHEGTVQVLDDWGRESEVRGPAVVGGVALLQHGDPALSVLRCGYRLATECLLWELHLRDLFTLLGPHPEALARVLSAARTALCPGEAAAIAAAAAGAATPRAPSRRGSGGELRQLGQPGSPGGGDGEGGGGGSPRSPHARTCNSLVTATQLGYDPGAKVTWAQLQQLTAAMQQELIARLDALAEAVAARDAGPAPYLLSSRRSSRASSAVLTPREPRQSAWAYNVLYTEGGG
eukprot:scaffold19.g1755.t1